MSRLSIAGSYALTVQSNAAWQFACHGVRNLMVALFGAGRGFRGIPLPVLVQVPWVTSGAVTPRACVCVFVCLFVFLLLPFARLWSFFSCLRCLSQIGGVVFVLSSCFGGVLAFSRVGSLVNYLLACVGCLLPRARARVRVVCVCVHARPG